ncbi:MAG: biopolymer transporter ExbD [Planctomycetota bacterium]|nr:biopolymer transporter ExbD [Planctomycetota bacterium]
MRTRENKPAQLELMPVMNLVTILIPLLLMGATVVNLAVIDATLPAISDEKPPPDEKSLQLTVAITDQGLGLKSGAGMLEESADLDLPCDTQPCAVDGYDYRGLTDALVRIKDDHPEEQNLILLPEERVPYEVLVRVMDAAREDMDTRTAQGEPRSLFPLVVMAGGAT